MKMTRLFHSLSIGLICFSFLALGCSSQQSEQPQPSTTAVDEANVSMPANHSAPLMESLDPAKLGIDFVHLWKPKDRYEALMLKTGFTGGGVCMGDYDGDGLSDVVLTRPHGGLQLYRNLGDFRFENVTAKAGISASDHWTTGVAMVDLNRDHQLDLVVCAYDQPNLVYLNQGDGTFQEVGESLGLNFRGASIKIAWADYDNDGDLDGYLTTNRLEPKGTVNVRYLGEPGNYSVAPEFLEQVGVLTLPTGEQKFFKAGQSDYLFKNMLVETGELKFQNATKEAQLDGYWHGLDVTWWDANGDAYPDLYVANDFTDPDQFFINNGDGTFTDVTGQALPSTPWFTMGAAFADLNRDGRLDLLATDMAGTTHYRQKMAMGSMDELAWFLDWMEPRQHMRNALFLNTGTDRFMEVAQAAGLANSDWTWSVKFADLDNDGFEDAYMTNGFTRDYLDSDFNLRLQQSGNKDSLAWYKAPVLEEANLAFQNQQSKDDQIHFEDVSKAWGVSSVGISFGAAFGDLDNDGDLDLIVNNFEKAPSVYRNRCPETNRRLKITLRGKESNSQGYGAVVKIGDQMRWVNPHNGYLSSNDPSVHFGLGDQEVIPEIEVRWPSGQVQTLKDVATNQTITISEAGASETVHVSDQETLFVPFHEPFREVKHEEKLFDDFAVQPLLPNKLSQLGPGMAWADVNDDGLMDLYLGGAAGQAGQLLVASDNGQYLAPQAAPFLADAESEDMGCLFLDCDSDGDLDLFVVSGGVEGTEEGTTLRDRLYVNDGWTAEGVVNWRLARDQLPDLRDSGGPVAAADVDRDGDLDLVVGSRVLPGQYPLSSPSRLLINQGGTFEDQTQTRSPALLEAGMVTSAVWSDVNNDGWCDLVLASEYGPLRLFLNRDGRLEEQTEAAGLAADPGWWNGLLATDLDADGDIDFVATNFGNNTKYHPDDEHPQLIFFADFDRSGKSDIVEAKATSAALLPTRGRSCSSNAMPVLRDRFKTYHSFASAALQDIYTEARLEDAVQRRVTNLKTAALINDGNGHFEMRKLPGLAQAAPGFGVQDLVVGERGASLFVAQNFYTAQRETGRMNGGVGALLVPQATSDKTADLGAVWPDVSGILVPEDAKSVAAVDINGDGWQDLVVAVNDGSPRCFLQRPPESPAPLRVNLQGLPGNASAVGAQILAVEHDGQQSLHVLMAGEGYLTQRPPYVYLPEIPERLIVQWPDGQRSEHEVNSDVTGSMTLKHPALP